MELRQSITREFTTPVSTTRRVCGTCWVALQDRVGPGVWQPTDQLDGIHWTRCRAAASGRVAAGKLCAPFDASMKLINLQLSITRKG